MTARKMSHNYDKITEWVDFGHFSNSTNCISLLSIRMPMALPEKLES